MVRPLRSLNPYPMNPPTDKDFKKQRVLLMYITQVSGHRQATVAIQHALTTIAPDIEAPSVNGFGYTYPILEKVIHKSYMSVIKRTPKVWDFLYDNPKVFKKSESLKNFLHRTSHKKLAKLFEQYKPDIVVCTQAFPCGMVADYKRENNLDIKLIGVLTDFAPHSYWINEGVDYYVVPSESVKERFISKGMDPKLIKVYGIPIRPRFLLHPDKVKLAESLGLDLQKPIVLIMGGGQGLGPIKSIAKSLIKIKTFCQIVVLAGTNKKIIKSLNKLAKKTQQKLFIHEFVPNVDEFMELATLIITKPGGMTTAESLSKGLPMIIVNPIPGQEMRNTDFLIHKGIGIRIDQTNDIGEEVEILLRSPERLAAMRKAALESAKPYSAINVARLILGQNEITDQEAAANLAYYV